MWRAALRPLRRALRPRSEISPGWLVWGMCVDRTQSTCSERGVKSDVADGSPDRTPAAQAAAHLQFEVENSAGGLAAFNTCSSGARTCRQFVRG